MTAQLYQLYATSGSSTGATGDTITAAAFNLPNKSGAGNRYILAVAYSDTTAPTITDTNGNTWGSPAFTATNTGAADLSVWDVKNVNAGSNKITITFGSAQQPIYWELQEWSGLSTTLGNAGGNTTVSQLGASLSVTSFTPTNNDSTGGNLLLGFFYDANVAGDAGPTSWVAGTAGGLTFTLLQAQNSMKTTSTDGLPCASEWAVQATHAAISVPMTATADTTARYNSVAIALPLASGAGTPGSGLRIVKSLKSNSNNMNSSLSVKVHFPVTGNAAVFMATTFNDSDLTAISDSDGDTWVDITPSGGNSTWYLKNITTARPTKILTLTTTATTNAMNVWLVDIAGAATGTLIGATGANIGVNVNPPAQTPHLPDITPQSASSIILDLVSDGNGPTTNLTTPSGSVNNNMLYVTGTEGDAAVNNLGDAFAFIYNTSKNAQSWSWNIPNITSVNGSAIEILPGPITAPLMQGVLGFIEDEW